MLLSSNMIGLFAIIECLLVGIFLSRVKVHFWGVISIICANAVLVDYLVKKGML